VAAFAKRIIQQEMRSGKMCFASWDEFREEFMAAFCPENKATTALMRLELDCYFQGQWNVEVLIRLQQHLHAYPKDLKNTR
jgi:hypothetical protein